MGGQLAAPLKQELGNVLPSQACDGTSENCISQRKLDETDTHLTSSYSTGLVGRSTHKLFCVVEACSTL